MEYSTVIPQEYRQTMQRLHAGTKCLPITACIGSMYITGIPKAWGLVPFLDVPQFSINRFDVLRIF